MNTPLPFTEVPATEAPTKASTPVRLWLALCCIMVVAMMLIGAITRLTESGLSMVEWRPLLGFLPPLDEAEWQRIFALYRETSEYRLENAGMTLAEFRRIFWWEYIHRLWGRLIGLVFALPGLWFLITRRLSVDAAGHLTGVFALGALQAVIGWWMVKSGFSGRHDVSQYRLAVHLALAFLILGWLFWIWLRSAGHDTRPPAPAPARHLATASLVCIAVAILSGALVAGLEAGRIYTDWPLIDGALVPDGLFADPPGWLAVFESPLTVQFDHRVAAYIVLGVVITLRIIAGREQLDIRCRRAADIVLAAAVLQGGLGIATLLAATPLTLAVLHQAGAILLFGSAIRAVFVMRGG